MNPFTDKKEIMYTQNCAYNVRGLADARDISSWTSCAKPLQLWPGPPPIPVCEQYRLSLFGQDPLRGQGTPQDSSNTFPQRCVSSPILTSRCSSLGGGGVSGGAVPASGRVQTSLSLSAKQV